jgi:hypothetical protein
MFKQITEYYHEFQITSGPITDHYTILHIDKETGLVVIFKSCIIQGKVFPVFNYENVWVSGDIAPPFLTSTLGRDE